VSITYSDLKKIKTDGLCILGIIERELNLLLDYEDSVKPAYAPKFKKLTEIAKEVSERHRLTD